jgi:hypothetical protein
MSCHRTLRFAFSILAILAVFIGSASRASAFPTIGSNNQSDSNCPPFASTVGPGSTAWISDWNPQPLTLYVSASYGASRIKDMPIRESVAILSDPLCVQGDTWIRIQYGDNIGWAVAVNRDGSYNLIPNGIGHDVSPIFETTCPPSMTSLLPGDTAWISDWNSKPLTLYAQAAYGSFQLGGYPPREVVNIRSKPICSQGDAWIRIEYWGNTGWMVAVNRDGSYNLIPVRLAALNRNF